MSSIVKLGVARVVLSRTRAGRQEVLTDPAFSALDEAERRLLRLVNGYTPLDRWADRFGAHEDLDGAVERLLARGLIVREPARPDPCLDD